MLLTPSQGVATDTIYTFYRPLLRMIFWSLHSTANGRNLIHV
jgi:hypothetical protein